jgi:hypothetical protein
MLLYVGAQLPHTRTTDSPRSDWLLSEGGPRPFFRKPLLFAEPDTGSFTS